MKKILQLLYRIQNTADMVALSFITAMIKAFEAITPSWVKINYQNILQWIGNKKQRAIARSQLLKQKGLEHKQKILEFKNKAQEKVQEFKDIDFSTKLIEYRVRARMFIKKHSIKHSLITAAGLTLVLIKKCYQFFSTILKVSPNQFALTIVLATAGTFAGINIYRVTNEIHQKEIARRSPASTEPAMPQIVRPGYYKENLRQFEIGDLKLPLYVKGINGTRSLTLDFKVTTNNRRTLQWLDANEHKVRDWLLLHFEPIEADFPLLPEGREIVKDKIQKELNRYLEEENVEGQIQSLQLVNILGSQ